MSSKLRLQESFGDSLLTLLRERGGNWPYFDALQCASYVADCSASSAKRFVGKLTSTTGPLIVRMTREGRVLEIKKHWQERRKPSVASGTLKRIMSITATQTKNLPDG